MRFPEPTLFSVEIRFFEKACLLAWLTSVDKDAKNKRQYCQLYLTMTKTYFDKEVSCFYEEFLEFSVDLPPSLEQCGIYFSPVLA